MQPLRDYQARAVENVRAKWAAGVRRVMLVSPPGSGKTRMGEEIVLEPLPAVWFAHREELVADAALRLRSSIGASDVGIIAPGHAPQPHARVQVISIQTALRRKQLPRADRLVADECFPAGTMVSGRPIETLLVGDRVLAYDHVDEKPEASSIVRVFKNKPSGLVKIWLSDGTYRICTPGHPYFVSGVGYVPAAQLKGRDLQGLRWSSGELSGSAECLLGCVPSEQCVDAHEQNEPGSRRECALSNAGAQPDARAGNSNEGTQYTDSNRSQAEDPWWKRIRDDGSAKDSARVPDRFLSRASHCDEIGARGLSQSLQDRSGESRQDDRDRSGRRIPCGPSQEGERLAEGCLFARARVDSVEVLERGSDGTFGGMCPDGYVYNIEVAGHHNYFADGLLVHNCHHMPADRWFELLAHYPEANMLMMTGTPCRQDGRALHGIADCMVVAIAYSQLVREGNLCEVKIFQPPKILQGIAQDPVEAWIRYADNSAGFAFFGSVDHAYECEHGLNERGVRAAVIEQGTEKLKRKQIIEAMREGELDVICNVQTMTEGVDIPRARVCMLASPVRHPGGFLQRTARVLRPHPSKQFAIIIDLPGATLLHGSPIEDREYSLDGTPIKRSNMTPLRQCPSCMAIIASSFAACTECRFEFKPETVERHRPKIFSLELEEVWAGKDTPPDAKRAEYNRLRAVQRETGRDLYYVLKSYKELFGDYPVITDATNQEKRDYLGKLYRNQKASGKAPKYVGVMFKRIFGHWPKGNGASAGA